MDIRNVSLKISENLTIEKEIILFLNSFEPYYLLACIIVGLIGNSIALIYFELINLK